VWQILPGPFRTPGDRSVAVSLWEVTSVPAVEYMKSFYGHITSGKSRAEALKLARSEIKAKYSNPLYRSVFVLYGEGQAAAPVTSSHVSGAPE